MANDMTPITRLEAIIAGQDLTPITRLEHFLKEYAGGGGSGGGEGSFVIGGTVSGTTLTLDKTAGEIFAAMKKQNAIVVLEQPIEGVEEFIFTFSTADAQLVNDVLYYTFRAGSDMQTAAATADVYPRMSLG